jgi:PilZ domain
MDSMNLRRATRYHLAVPVLFKWENRAGDLFQGEGVTRDISVAGAFILTSDCPSPGIVLTVEVFLPQLRKRGQSIRMVTEGRVVRTENPVPGQSQDGFAVVGKDFAIQEVAVNS